MKICKWRIEESDWDVHWETGCGKAFCFIVDGPKENDMKYCPYCGKRLKEKSND